MYKRNWYDERGYKPHVFYAVFGANQENLQLSSEKYHVEKVPNGININAYSKENSEHKKYISHFFEHQIGEFLKEKDETLFEKSKSVEECIIIQGEIEEDENLEYLKNIIGIIQGLCDAGAVSILDLHTLTWYSSEEWTDNIFEKEFQVYNHVRMLISEKEDGLWLHSRGLAKFGRPDLSLLGIPKAGIELAKDLTDQFFHYSAQGIWFDKPIHLNTTSGKFLIKFKYVEDFNNYDFNNAFVEIQFNDIIIVEKGTVS